MNQPVVTSDAAASGMRYVFVYGTLRQGDDNDITRLTPAPQFVGVAKLAGVMYHLGAYPGVVLGSEMSVQGEVYAITPALERQLDEIEELYPQRKDEYFKRMVPIAVRDCVLMCIVYEINPQYITGARTIVSGDWVRDRHA